MFRHPPKDHTAYPALQAAISPHIESFNALFEPDGLIAQGLKDIGTKTYLDGDDKDDPKTRNSLDIRIKEVRLDKASRHASDKFAKGNRETYPAECRERHCTYKGRLTATLEYRINGGDPQEFTRDIGMLPLMVKVRCGLSVEIGLYTDKSARATDATSRTIPRPSWSSGKKSLRN